jgi:uncharacterized protein (TIGR00255 family)
MIRSMTAFARAAATDEGVELVWELRSVNHRYLETNLRLPEEMRVLEPLVRERLARRLGRGKIDCGLRYKSTGAAAHLQINQTLADQVLLAARELEQKMPGAEAASVMDVLNWPGMLEPVKPNMGPAQQAAAKLLEQAIDELIQTREREGGRLQEHISARCQSMHEQVERARIRVPLVLEQLRGRLRNRLAELAGELDPDRLEQEMVMLAQRLDVDEEMDRLNTHLDEVISVLQRDEPVGRRLDFLMQELNREANTLGSKSADSETTAISVEMKVLIEQMREQVQNIE